VSTARQVLERNAKLFEERDRALTALARTDPERHAPARRTWQDWRELHRRAQEEHADGPELDRMYRALMLSPSTRDGLEICRALLRGEHVPLELLDQGAVRRYGLR
jgi:hypothetical protein